MTESEIRKLVENRKNEIDVVIDNYTPSGRPRSLPMFTANIKNDYLGKTKTIKTTDQASLELRIRNLVTKWSDEEINLRIKEQKKKSINETRQLAEDMNKDAANTIESLRRLLDATLDVDDTINWNEEYQKGKMELFTPTVVRPVKTAITKRKHPKFSFWAYFLPWAYKKHKKECLTIDELFEINTEAQHKRHLVNLANYEASVKKEKDHYEQKKQEFEDKQKAHNKSVVDFRRRFESGEKAAISEYCERVLSRSIYPDIIQLNTAVQYDDVSKYVEVAVKLPAMADFPEYSGHKHVKSGNKISPIKLKVKERKELYASTLDQIILRTAHEIIESCYIPGVEGVVVTGFVEETNKATGLLDRKQTHCISTTKHDFEKYDLSKIEPKACIAMLSQNVSSLSGVA